MSFVHRLRVRAFLLGFAATAVALPALADLSKDQCIDANAKGQDLLHDGKWTAARAQFHACAASSCPKMLRADCTKRLDELDSEQPAIVFEAKDGAGNDLSVVSVTMDGATIANKLDGTSFRLDPGEHVFVFTAAGLPSVTKRLVLAERDQSRREVVVLGSAPVPAASVAAAPGAAAPLPSRGDAQLGGGASESARSGGMSTLRVVGIAGGAVGLVGLGIGGIFGAMAGSASSSQQSNCPSPTDCPNRVQAVADHSTYQTDSTIEAAAFIGGGALLVAGIVMFIAGGNKEEPTRTAISISPTLSPGVTGLTLRGGF
jgi:hypothetical protein